MGDCGVKKAVALRPITKAEAVLPYIEELNMVLVMTVEPGFGGQAFMEDQLDTIRHVRAIIQKYNPACELEVDGGVAPTQKYVKIIEEINKKLERERLQQIQGMKEKRIQNEGKSYSAVQPEIRVNQAYFERTGKSYELTKPEINPRKEEEQSLARVTGKEFAESLRRRAAKTKEKSLEITDMSEEIEDIPDRKSVV